MLPRDHCGEAGEPDLIPVTPADRVSRKRQDDRA